MKGPTQIAGGKHAGQVCTVEFAKKREKNRKRQKLAKLAKKKNR